MRLYFNLTSPEGIPLIVNQLKTVGGRPGYDQWNQRLNNRDIIDDLLEIGYTLGGNQDENRIRALIPDNDLAHFNHGFNRP
jgi:hypothetical protein